MTEWTLKREKSSETSTQGVLTMQNKKWVFTLEDVERDIKIAGITAIPKGKYEVIITFSKKFQRDLPLLLDVPNFSGVRIHSGNKSTDTEGCILVGLSKDVDSVYSSKNAMIVVMDNLITALRDGKVYLNII